jgi:hypothetical protein
MTTGPEKSAELNANDVTEFLMRVQEIRDLEGWFKGDRQWGPWFRGHQIASWPLKPKLYRDREFNEVQANEVEDEMREEFIKRAPVLCETVPIGTDRRTEWEWYFMMQHFGAATRLLDWTEGALIALYFAVRSNDGRQNAAVWVLDPYQLNKRVVFKGGEAKEWIIPPSAVGVSEHDQRLVSNWLPERFTKMGGLPKHAVAIEPTHVVSRISSQHSCFTIHGEDSDSLDQLQFGQNACLKKIVIPGSNANEIKRDLRLYGINETTIFPDLDGLGRAINARWDIGEHNRSNQKETK